jgi:hypothetical protein
MAFPGMDNREPAAARCRQYGSAGLNSHTQARNVIAKGCTKPSRLKKIALHIDDEECGAIQLN